MTKLAEWLIGVLLALLLALAPPPAQAQGTTLSFVGAACSDSWRTDLYLVGDSSSLSGPVDARLEYIPFGDAPTTYGADVTIPGGDPRWESFIPDIVCAFFPQAEGTTGVLQVVLPFEADGWGRTWSPPGYGQVIEPASMLEYSSTYLIPTYDAQAYRCNLLLFNPDMIYSIAVLGDQYVFVEPRQAIVVRDVAPGVLFEVVSGGRLEATLSLVYNATNDPITLPMLEVAR